MISKKLLIRWSVKKNTGCIGVQKKIARFAHQCFFLLFPCGSTKFFSADPVRIHKIFSSADPVRIQNFFENSADPTADSSKIVRIRCGSKNCFTCGSKCGSTRRQFFVDPRIREKKNTASTYNRAGHIYLDDIVLKFWDPELQYSLVLYAGI